MRPIRFGLLGYGDWGQWHARCINETEDALLVAIAEKTEEGRKKAEADFSVQTYSNYRDLIDKEDIDVVDVTLPNFLHYDAAIAALRAGKNLLLEKPMGLTLEECDLILKASQQNLVGKRPLLAIGFELRLSSLCGQVKKLIEEGVIGTPRSLNMEVFRSLPEIGSGKWRLDKKKAGSWILDGSIHYLDLIRWYFQGVGEPLSLYSVANSSKDKALVTNFSTVICFSEDSYGVLYYSMGGFGHYITVKVVGDDGAIWASWEGSEGTSSEPKFRLEYGVGKVRRECNIERPAGEVFDLKAEIEEVVRAVREGGSSSLATGYDGRDAVRLCLTAERSLQSGKIEEI